MTKATYKINYEKIRVWAGDFFGHGNVEVEDRPNIDRIHLTLRLRNIRMSEHEKFTRWFYKEYGVLLSDAHISGGGLLTTRTKYLVQYLLPRMVEVQD